MSELMTIALIFSLIASSASLFLSFLCIRINNEKAKKEKEIEDEEYRKLAQEYEELEKTFKN